MPSTTTDPVLASALASCFKYHDAVYFQHALENDPHIKAIREQFFGQEILADSEEGQALLGKVAIGEAHFVEGPSTRLYNEHGRLVMDNGMRPSDWLLSKEPVEIPPAVVDIINNHIEAREVERQARYLELADRRPEHSLDPLLQGIAEMPVTVQSNAHESLFPTVVVSSNEQVHDELALNTGCGSNRSRIQYMLNILRDSLHTHKRLEQDLVDELELSDIAKYHDVTTAYVNVHFEALVQLIKTMHRDNGPDGKDDLYTVVENLGCSLFSKPDEDGLYLHVDGFTAQIQ